MSDDEYRELERRVMNILNGNYDIHDKHILAIRLEHSKLFSKFLDSLQYDEIAEKNVELISRVLDCLEY